AATTSAAESRAGSRLSSATKPAQATRRRFQVGMGVTAVDSAPRLSTVVPLYPPPPPVGASRRARGKPLGAFCPPDAPSGPSERARAGGGLFSSAPRRGA